MLQKDLVSQRLVFGRGCRGSLGLIGVDENQLHLQVLKLPFLNQLLCWTRVCWR